MDDLDSDETRREDVRNDSGRGVPKPSSDRRTEGEKQGFGKKYNTFLTRKVWYSLLWGLGIIKDLFRRTRRD